MTLKRTVADVLNFYLHLYLHSLCDIYSLIKFVSGFETTLLMQTVRKYLVYEYVPIVEKTFRSDTGESCVAQRSIYVILRGNEGTRRYINQVRNALRYFMPVII
jgi:hypothetical protein